MDMVVEAPPEQRPFAGPPSQPNPEEVRIAKNLMPFIQDGSCIQLGIGSLPDSVGKLIAQSDLRNLGGHTEIVLRRLRGHDRIRAHERLAQEL